MWINMFLLSGTLIIVIFLKEIDLHWGFLVYQVVESLVMMNSGVIWPSDWWSQCPTQQRSLLNRAVSLWINPINHCRDLCIDYNTTSWPVPFFQEGLHIWGSIPLWSVGQLLLHESAYHRGDPSVSSGRNTIYCGFATLQGWPVHF